MNKYENPPKLFHRLFRWCCRPELLVYIEGDLLELYEENVRLKGRRKARWIFRREVVKLIRPGLVQFLKDSYYHNYLGMLKNYLKVALRNLWKYKSATIINAIGLSTGMAAFVLIALFVKDELSYDRHHEHAENIYRVTVKNYTTEGALSRQWAFASAGHAQRLKADYPEITHAVRFFPWAFPDIDYQEQHLPGEPVIFADDDVFDIFTFPFIVGDPNTAFNDIHSIVLTESSAIRVFGNSWKEQDILGEQVRLSAGGNTATFKVTGVMQDMPDQQHFHFEYLAPMRFLEPLLGEDAMNNTGGNYNWMTFVRVVDDANIPALTQKADAEFWDKYVTLSPGTPVKPHEVYAFEFQPLVDIHLKSNLEGEYEANGSLQQVYIFSAVGILLLLVACVNYMNLATSHYSRRMREVGVRKVVGAHRSALISQFLTESSLITLVSLPLAGMLIYLALPFLNDFVDKALSFNPFVQQDILISLIVLMLLIGLVAGLYPALFLSRINLVVALKGEQAAKARKWNFRSWLVTFQYAVVIALVFTLLVIEGQMKFIRNTNPGFQKDQVVVLNLTNNINNLDVFKRELLNHPHILKGAYASRIPTGRLADNMGASFFNEQDSLVNTSFRLPYIRVDEDFLTTFEIPLIAGTDFTRDQDMATDSIGYYIINRTAAEAFGFTDPNEIIGKRLAYGNFNGVTGPDGRTYQIGRILGVTEDFNFESFHSTVVPMVMLKEVKSNRVRRIALKIDPADLKSTLAHIEETWGRFDQENPVTYRFLDELFEQQYVREERLSTMIKVFTLIAILIGCLGLVGMVGFLIETRIKEIGIRKVLGASVQSIWLLIGQRFLLLIGIGALVALPVTWWLMNDWLQNFVYRTSISMVIVVLPVLIAVVLTALAISFQTIKASLINPVECLQDE